MLSSADGNRAASMIVGLGIDVCELARVRRSVDRHGERFLRKVLSPPELAVARRRTDPALFFAGRFAAKEAAVKALGAPPGLRWYDLEVTPAVDGPPGLRFHRVAARRADELEVARTLLSITHDAGVAAAVVILEADRP